MKRRIRFELYVDYNKLMNKNKISQIESGYCSEEEEEYISKLINLLHSSIPFIEEIHYCIEDYEKKTIKGFERSNKMGSALSKISIFKVKRG